MSKIKIVVRKMKQEFGGQIAETTLNDIRCEVKKAKDFMSEEAIKIGYNYDVKWRSSGKAENSVTVKTPELELADKSVVWCEAFISWEHGSITKDEVVKAILSP